MKDGGRGYTDSVNNVKANEALKGLKKKEFKDAEIKFNAAHQIADWFEGSGYKKTLNLLTTSAEYNKGDMLRAERRIANSIEEIQENVDAFITFDLNITSKYSIITDNDIVKSLSKQNMTKEDAESAKELLDKHTDPVLVKEVLYFVKNYYIGGDLNVVKKSNIEAEAKEDTTLREILK